MVKKNEKRICWNCDGDVSLHIDRCPYCGVSVSNPAPPDQRMPYQRHEQMTSPFQSTQAAEEDPFTFHPRPSPLTQNLSVSEKEWNQSLDETEEKEELPSGKKEMIALVLLLPGIVFFLFGLLLLLFSKEGSLTLHWSQNLAYFYFLGAIPLVLLGWRSIK